ncbi:hypothetical protein [Roseiarcus sp.]|uniref:hypothetical protein n=1 Tax=Roseiarcus sp. TaxID=1969460 RepID=UPI003F98C5E7
MSMTEIHEALTQHLIAAWGERPTIAPRHAASMIGGWSKFTDFDSQETGGRQCDAWMDPVVVRLLDESLNAHYLRHEPYVTFPNGPCMKCGAPDGGWLTDARDGFLCVKGNFDPADAKA